MRAELSITRRQLITVPWGLVATLISAAAILSATV
jgi:hypothetical protein